MVRPIRFGQLCDLLPLKVFLHQSLSAVLYRPYTIILIQGIYTRVELNDNTYKYNFGCKAAEFQNYSSSLIGLEGNLSIFQYEGNYNLFKKI